MPIQHTQVHVIEQSPLRVFAREALMAARIDQVRGVLAWRVAQRLMDTLRERDRRGSARLEAVNPNERAFYISLAHQVLELGDRILGTDPPTAAEVARYESTLALQLARGRVRCQAAAHWHVLSVWRPDPDRPAHELAACQRCGAGASIHIASGSESISTQLLSPCPSRPTSPFQRS